MNCGANFGSASTATATSNGRARTSGIWCRRFERRVMSRRSRHALLSVLSLGCSLASARASAQVDLGAFGRALARQASPGSGALQTPLPSLFSRGRGGGVPVIVHAPGGMSVPELVSLGDFALGELPA